MTALARALFAVLLVATFAAFFVAQRLKTSDPLVEDVRAWPFFSPNQDGRFERTQISFQLERTDRVDLQILDERGEIVAEPRTNWRARRGRTMRLRWDGTDDEGRRLPDGTYGLRLVLRRQARSVRLPREVLLDTTPPVPEVLSVGPEEGASGPELLPRADGQPATVRFRAPGRLPSVTIWRTDGEKPEQVAELDVPEQLDDEVGTATWDGTVDGRRVPAGTYVAVVQSRDQAGNIGSSVPRAILERGPRRGDVIRSKGGITVRYLGIQPSLLPVRGGRSFDVAVDARGQTYNWSLRRVGAPQPVRRSRRGTGGELRRPVPDGKSGLFLFEAHTRNHAARVPVVVDDKADHEVLVVLPATTWQGRNRLDDDGDGLPNTLAGGVPVRLSRVFAGDGLPAGLAENEAPLLAHLDRQGLGYDLTTDVALAAGRGPQLEGHRGVLLAGDTVWLTEDVRRALRSFVEDGGTLASLGTGSLRAKVRQTADALTDATVPGDEDHFGALLGPVTRRQADLTILDDDPNIQLFAGEEGLFPAVQAWEPTLSVGDEARRASVAVTPEGDEVIVAARFGDGIVIRTGIPGFATRLSGDTASAELLGRIFTLLRAG